MMRTLPPPRGRALLTAGLASLVVLSLQSADTHALPQQGGKPADPHVYFAKLGTISERAEVDGNELWPVPQGPEELLLRKENRTKTTARYWQLMYDGSAIGRVAVRGEDTSALWDRWNMVREGYLAAGREAPRCHGTEARANAFVRAFSTVEHVVGFGENEKFETEHGSSAHPLRSRIEYFVDQCGSPIWIESNLRFFVKVEWKSIPKKNNGFDLVGKSTGIIVTETLVNGGVVDLKFEDPVEQSVGKMYEDARFHSLDFKSHFLIGTWLEVSNLAAVAATIHQTEASQPVLGAYGEGITVDSYVRDLGDP
ncbi:MAG: hypothetical protein HYY17_11195 [Planctomycetes bacterium]|nr:hypothetical protein [Planctomycetota bacterium]